MTYQNVPKNVIYIFVSKSCMLKQLSTLLSLEGQNNPLFNVRGLCNFNVLCTPTYLN
jgi:hypothetical protein